MPAFIVQMCHTQNPLPTSTESWRVGFTATRKIGGAVARNRAKRRLRALARDIMTQHACQKYDYVFVARSLILTRPYHLLVRDLEIALTKLHKN